MPYRFSCSRVLISIFNLAVVVGADSGTKLKTRWSE
jgi:hypothetical protein